MFAEPVSRAISLNFVCEPIASISAHSWATSAVIAAFVCQVRELSGPKKNALLLPITEA